MRTATAVSGYVGCLVLVFGAAVGVGHAVGPLEDADVAPSQHSAAHPEAGAAATDSADSAPSPRGLAVSQDGYTLQLDRTVLTPGRPTTLSFTVAGPDGRPVTAFTPEHGKELHLIVVRRDLTGYQHLHPERDAAGTWSVPLTVPEAGPYKVYADFTPSGRVAGLTLAADLTAPGVYMPAPAQKWTRAATVDGYDVQLAGNILASSNSVLTLTVSKDGRPVTDLDPYLGAYGHLVAIRDGDLAYLHVHPEGDVEGPSKPAGPDITFTAEVPSPGTYRLFLDFKHAGVVRTAAFTSWVTAAGSSSSDVPRVEDGQRSGASPHSETAHDH